MVGSGGAGGRCGPWVVYMWLKCVAKCAMLIYRYYDVTPYIIAQEVRQMRHVKI